MAASLLDPTNLRAALLLCVPLTYLIAAIVAGRSAATAISSWRWAGAAAVVASAGAVASMAWLVTSGPLVVRMAPVATGDTAHFWISLRADAVGASVLLLVSFIGWVIVRYSKTYLAGDPDQPRYVRWLLATLTAVTIVLVTNNLAILALAWTATSLALHRLLTFYSERPAALIAAHKKFIASRFADLFLVLAVALIGTNLGTLEIDLVAAHVRALPELTTDLRIAAVLVVLTALLRCAQLPIHGWLIQVMEAPTPVSALLHAGVVNLGGFVLIRLSELVSAATAAQTLLVIVGCSTAVVAALVMTTRISVKVMLAWSTCAQMGFMLMQCGLGMYELALLHLVAHSLYKAHAFLAAGGAVEQVRVASLSKRNSPELGQVLLGTVAGIAAVAVVAVTWDAAAEATPALWVLAAIAALALTPLLSAPGARTDLPWRLAAALGAFGIAATYFGLHDLSRAWFDLPDPEAAVSPGLVMVVLAGFSMLFVTQAAIRTRPNGLIARRLYPWFYAGLYLDELFTRSTFRLWPVASARDRAAAAVSSIGKVAQ
jgi:NAD(P)H-quinone oxidoreductase subunit 5